MAIDVERVIETVTRELASRQHEGQQAWVLALARTFEVRIGDLWDALTNGERIPQWFLPISGDLREGGHFQLKGNASGEIIACEAPTHLGLTWRMHGQVSWVDLYLTDRGSRAGLRLEHMAHVPADMWNQFGPGAVGIGWDSGFMGLGEHLTGKPAVVPEEAEAWMASEEGRAFVAASSNAWCNASTAAGTDPATARAAANRVAALYCGDS